MSIFQFIHRSKMWELKAFVFLLIAFLLFNMYVTVKDYYDELFHEPSVQYLNIPFPVEPMAGDTIEAGENIKYTVEFNVLESGNRSVSRTLLGCGYIQYLPVFETSTVAGNNIRIVDESITIPLELAGCNKVRMEGNTTYEVKNNKHTIEFYTQYFSVY